MMKKVRVMALSLALFIAARYMPSARSQQAGDTAPTIDQLAGSIKPRGIVQPAIKCRGPEYLRIIYGPEYLLPCNLDRLKSRAVGAKRSLASREFALGVEVLERSVRKEPLRRTHECVFGVLALESEAIDPRL